MTTRKHKKYDCNKCKLKVIKPNKMHFIQFQEDLLTVCTDCWQLFKNGADYLMLRYTKDFMQGKYG